MAYIFYIWESETGSFGHNYGVFARSICIMARHRTSQISEARGHGGVSIFNLSSYLF